MSIPGSASPLFFQTAAGAAAAAGPIKSVRFNSGDSAYLNRTPSSAGNRTTWTWAGWIKRSSTGNQRFFTAGANGTYDSMFQFVGSGTHSQLEVWNYQAGDKAKKRTIALFRDFSAWYHVVVSCTSSTLKIYVNGTEADYESGGSNVDPDGSDWSFNSTVSHTIGKTAWGSEYFNGYLADVYWIDGQAKDPTDFGAFDDSGVWQAATYSGTFGTNGFHLFDFANESGIGNDSSGNDNDFTVNNISTFPTAGPYVSQVSGSDYNATYSKVKMFDSSETTAYLAGDSSTVTWTITNGLAFSSQLRVRAQGGGATGTITFNWSGGSYDLTVLNAGAQYYDVTSNVTSPITSITWTTGASAVGPYVSAWEVDGSLLLDASQTSGEDVLRDVPTNGTQSETGAGGEVSANYCTLNPLDKATVAVLSDGNLRTNSSGTGAIRGTFKYPKTGKWYYEVQPIDDAQYNTGYFHVGIATADANLNTNPGYDTTNEFTYWQNGRKTNNVAYAASFTAGDIIGVAFDADAGSLTFYKNGVSQGVNSTGLTGEYFPYAPTWNYNAAYNFGQRAFAHPISGYLPLSTTNLPTPIANGRDHFDTKLYTGNGGSSTITVSGYNFAPNLVWLKGRSDPDKHGLYDTVRGATKLLIPSSANGESTQNGVTAFNSDGFDIGNYAETNGSSRTYVAWAWNVPGSASSNSDGTITSSVTKNADAGISIVTWTGTGSAGTVGHGLGSKPDLIIAKVYGDSSYSDNWPVYSSVFDGTHYAYLNDTRKFTDYSDFWNDGTATSTVFPVGSDNSDNTKSLLALCFTSVAGFSSIGSYEGNGSTTAGVFVHTNFRPAWILIKRADTSSSYASWAIYDSTRSTFNTTGTSSYNFPLWANRDAQEGKRGDGSSAASGAENIINFFSNGFMALGSGAELNVANETYVYMAFASNPFSANGGLAF